MDEHLKTQRNFFIRLKKVFDHFYVDALRKYHQNKMFQQNGERRPVVKKGDTVLIKPTNTFKENSPLTKVKWDIGQVVNTTINRYNEVRTIDVQYIDDKGKTKVLENQPIQFFAPLEVDNHEEFLNSLKQPAEIPGNEIKDSDTKSFDQSDLFVEKLHENASESAVTTAQKTNDRGNQ
jgi:hypothetical protein